jgi:hypothetical protein
VHKIPRQLIIGDSIPKGPTGKLQRIGLAEQLADRLSPEFRAPQTQTEQVLGAIWQELLETRRVGLEDNFFVSGGTSLLAARLVTRFREETGKALPLDDVFRYPTLAGLAAAADGAGQGSQAADNAGGRWEVVFPIQPRGDRPPLVLVSFGLGWEAGPLSRHLGPDQPVYSLRPPPDRSAELRQMNAEALAAFYVREMRKVRPRGPYVLAGGCAAGLIAYEMARQLVREGVAPPAVCLFDVYWPPPRFLPYGLACWLMRLPRTIGLYAAAEPRQRFVNICRRSCYWLARLTRLALPFLRDDRDDHKADDELVGYIEQLSDSQPQGIWRYDPRVYEGRVGAFLSADTGTWPFRDRRPMWRKAARGGFDIFVVPGEHHHAFEEPDAAGVAEILRRFIDSTRGDRVR